MAVYMPQRKAMGGPSPAGILIPDSMCDRIGAWV